ncbi:DUF2510 domain-containing protein [Streptomyces sp. NPDC002845]
MTQVTPPGWYPDPGQTSDGPATERWWDGKAWTDQIRPVGSADAWGAPAHPSNAAGAYPAYPPAPRRRGLRTGIAVAVAAAVLASIGVGAFVLTRDGGGSGASSSQGPSGQNGQGGQDPAPGQSGPPQQEEGYATDLISGISIPVPDGWSGGAITVGAQVMSEDTYECPGDTSKSCTRGGAYSAPARTHGLDATTARAAAEEDISKNAEESYGGTTYGSITSHEELASEAVTVAGQKGYLVRWKVITSKGDDGYVESLAFPSPADSDSLVVVRFGVDVSDESPGPAVIDEITEGIKAASVSGGNGQNV